jgi:hypothetical protein
VREKRRGRAKKEKKREKREGEREKREVERKKGEEEGVLYFQPRDETSRPYLPLLCLSNAMPFNFL